MADRKLHIVSFDVPFPATYGGVIDVYYKIKALHRAGIKIILHCYQYGRKAAPELEAFCDEVYYYKRSTGLFTWLSTRPYIITGRDSNVLLKRLLADDHPILMEGIHCAALMMKPELAGRQLFLRMHNIEQDYYLALAKAERSLLKRYYFRSESSRLKKFEKNISKATMLLPISQMDENELKTRFRNVSLLPAFHPGESVSIPEGTGDFALYHGNLSVRENDEATLYLVKEVFNDLSIPLVIAGNNPSAGLVQAARRSSNVKLQTGLDTEGIMQLIRTAQINVLPTFQSTGIKLKLLAALFGGRHCVVNDVMVAGNNLGSLCEVCDSPAQMKKALQRLFKIPVEKEILTRRKNILEKEYANRLNAQHLIRLLGWSQ